jgi:peptidoglycan hydrolase CwlO-like protein
MTGLTLNQVRKNRKEVETDVTKLHNRIKMLQNEEEKALKKIDETRKKAK